MNHQRMRGFTLVELSLVLLALGLILPAAVILWQLSERQSVSAVQMTSQKQARDALLGFLHAGYRLPCPAADTLGVADCSVGQVGFLPWRTLGLPRPDSAALRYGVDRRATGNAVTDPPLDQDLAVARDRMNPLRVRTPDPRPSNGDAPNPNAPPIPTASDATVLGTTYSGNDAAPLNTAACNAANAPPCPLAVVNAVNLIDICLALNVASLNPAVPAVRLATQVGATARPVAFVIAAPGMLDANGDGQAFDGLNASATHASPVFEAPGRAVNNTYDDIVVAGSHTELFAELHCGASLSAISHGHFNAATGALVMERAMYDYRDQLYIAIKLAEADVAAAAAGVASAVAGSLDAAKEMVSAVADTTMSVGARSFQIALAAVGIGLAVASDVAAGYAVADAAISLAEAKQVHADFADYTLAMTELARSINENALRADAIGH